ncbi:flavoprotein [Microbispora triticiradicis]|uniref:flavoprotein n=1 Tax=Microbispora triticiradicis TaxID=2200763 RepID=UPI0027DDF7F0|nr:flavoprotein [Microbispora triticiradicis]
MEKQTGRPVRSQYRKPTEPKSPRADAIIVAPASYNTINKFAQGIADTYALGLLAEALGLGIPIVVLPFVNSALAARKPFRLSSDSLRSEGVDLPAPGTWPV